MYNVRVRLPEVLSIAEFRANLAAHVNRVKEPDAVPLFVGPYRKPEVVVMSVQQYEQLISDDERNRRELIVAEGVATNRLEGAKNSPEMLEAMRAWAEGEIDLDEVTRRRRARRG